MKKNLYVLLMAGGVGTRFWPYSRNEKPKQFLDVLGTGNTLLQSTYERFLPLCPKENIFVVTNEEHAQLTTQQLPDLKASQILAEPMRKNTAPCIVYASKKIARINPDANIVVSPADHVILNEREFQSTIKNCVKHAEKEDILVTLGIKPTRPETGYGYIQYIEGKSKLKKVKTFTEKPELKLAKKFVETGEFVWNSGIFIWNVKSILKALERELPEMFELFVEAEKKFDTLQEKKATETAYMQAKSISIDYGVMEKADNVYVWPSNFNWSDLGSWAALHELSKKDKENNSVVGDTLLYDTRNTIIRGSKDKLIVVQGLNGYLVGAFGNVVIVCEKDKEELFRQFVTDLKTKSNGGEFL
ncbi:MAG: mannose-1-phosphate guanylyltransferase [Flammeovirgaceae bacterium]|nr:mannose-1-phosphate guanylyltransferase [Flammeovirgaceae bacterium]